MKQAKKVKEMNDLMNYLNENSDEALELTEIVEGSLEAEFDDFILEETVEIRHDDDLFMSFESFKDQSEIDFNIEGEISEEYI